MKDRIRILKTEEIGDGFSMVKKRVYETVIDLMYKGVKVPDDFDELLADLRSADMLDKIFIYDKEFAKVLVDEGVAENIYGERYRRTSMEKVDAFRDRIYAAKYDKTGNVRKI